MAFEALNHIGQAQTPMVIILNDNEMSISRNVGALMKHLGYMRATPSIVRRATRCRKKLESSGPFGTALANFGRNEGIDEAVRHSALDDLRAAGHPVHGAHRRHDIAPCAKRFPPCCYHRRPRARTWSRRKAPVRTRVGPTPNASMA